MASGPYVVMTSEEFNTTTVSIHETAADALMRVEWLDRKGIFHECYPALRYSNASNSPAYSFNGKDRLDVVELRAVVEREVVRA